MTPSSDSKTIGSLTEDIAQSFHLMAQIFAEQSKENKKHHDRVEEHWAKERPPDTRRRGDE
jgi:hypothetical protein